jgi:hypothetical protein
MTSPLRGIDPFDPHLHRRYDCTATNHTAHSENSHTKFPTSLDMPRNASKNDTRRHSTIRYDAHNQIQSHFNRPTKTPIPMFSAVACPNLPLTSRDDATAVPGRPMKLTLLSKNDEAQKHRETETVHQSANFVTDKNNTNQLKSPKNLFRGKNPILDEGQKIQIAYPVASRNSPPTPTLAKVPLTFHTNVLDETRQQALNQLDDYIPQAPPGSPPYSTSSPKYSPVYCSPIMDYPDYASDSTSGTDTTIFDEDDDEPLVE